MSEQPEKAKNLPAPVPKEKYFDTQVVANKDDQKEHLTDDKEKIQLSADEEHRLKKQEYAHQQHHQNTGNFKQAVQHNNHGRDHGQNQIQRRGDYH